MSKARHVPLLAAILSAATLAACDLRADSSGGTIGGGGGGGGTTGGGDTNVPTGQSPATVINPNTASTPVGSPVRTIGRVFTNTTNKRLQMSWPGTALQFSTKASALKVSLALVSDPVSQSAAAGVVFLVDGVVSGQKSVLTADGDVAVPGLDGGLHVITMIKSSEAQAGDLQYVGVSGGSLEATTQAAPGRAIEFIGDSISAGYGVDGTPGDTNTCYTSSRPLGGADPTLSNAVLAHPSVAARTLKADWSTVAYSGKGIYRNLDPTDAVTMTSLWPLASPDINLSWPFPASGVPDAVVINLGTNDFNRKDALDSSAFASAYAAFLSAIRKAYPQAYLLVVVPMLSDSVFMADGQKQLTQATQAIAMGVAQSGIQSRIATLKLQGSTNLSCDGHPDAAGQDLIAQQVVTALKSLTGW